MQHLNIAQWGERAIEKIARHYKLFRKLWVAFEKVAEHAISLGAAVVVEWPRYCRYWSDKRVRRFLKKHCFVDAVFDGCMYGLTAMHGEKKGLPIKKPWRISCVNTCLPNFLNTLCDKSHDMLDVKDLMFSRLRPIPPKLLAPRIALLRKML